MKNTINLANFKLLNHVGEGTFGEVHRVKEKATGQIYAAKISKNTIKETSRDERLNLKREVNALSQLNHPSILKFIGYSPKNFNGESKPVIITEYLSHGSLDKLIHSSMDPKSGVTLDETNKLIILYGIASAMSYIHSKGYIHRDLKPANILIDDSLYPVIADLGLAKIIRTDTESVDQTKTLTNAPKGTPMYISPEIILAESNDQPIVYTSAVDVYAFSIIMYQLFAKEEPFPNFTPYKIFDRVSKGERPTLTNDIPKNYQKLIKKCWSQDPNERPSFSEIVEELKSDKFTKGNVNKEEFNKYIDYIQSTSLIYPAKNLSCSVHLAKNWSEMLKQILIFSSRLANV